MDDPGEEIDISYARPLYENFSAGIKYADYSAGDIKVETYLAEHTEARFTHGLCDACRDRHYPDVTARSWRADGAGPESAR